MRAKFEIRKQMEKKSGIFIFKKHFYKTSHKLFNVKKNQIGSAISKSLCYIDTDIRHSFCYFYKRIIIILYNNTYNRGRQQPVSLREVNLYNVKNQLEV